MLECVLEFLLILGGFGRIDEVKIIFGNGKTDRRIVTRQAQFAGIVQQKCCFPVDPQCVTVFVPEIGRNGPATVHDGRSADANESMVSGEDDAALLSGKVLFI